MHGRGFSNSATQLGALLQATKKKLEKSACFENGAQEESARYREYVPRNRVFNA